jgi:hypothetical protein
MSEQINILIADAAPYARKMETPTLRGIPCTIAKTD